jgi:hypothetical protein
LTAENITNDGLFRLNPNARAGMNMLGGRVPVLFVDDVFADPERVRDVALGLDYHAPDYPYPGKLAEIGEDASLTAFLRTILAMVNAEYLPRIPPIADGQRTITAFGRVLADFAITDVHPDELSDVQRRPHIDPVPIFGLVYLNPVERGGTLFFNPRGNGDGERSGYLVESDEEYELVARIEGNFNRLAVYPGFIPHTGEIEGDWIMTDERFNAPRLTQRLVFFP